ncbi:dienelactone hydrolase family protein [Pseudothauera rhizosphaerae]|uniref:Alpha/beta hydrolase n=1 Tax=Pseudothauera rhizosphaerae TaxID=2565932 RepID=A0A4S4AUC1_9RHOO|nr:alpha/beta hydrolase [Pseudothauera rhizosphaerae]THF63488.1 alpha/beta hydrolase [Pseudothauera rhizosphaerae]
MKLRHSLIGIPSAQVWLEALLCHAPDVRALAVILQPFSTPPDAEREDEVTRQLQAAGFATLTVDLLTAYEEARDPDARYNVPQLALRIEGVRDWIAHQPMLRMLEVGLLASGTASGATIRAAGRAPEQYAALACRGGRPDLAGAKPLRVLATPVRFVVGGRDPGLAMLRQSYEHLTGERDWQAVSDCDDGFAVPGALAAYARLATEWLLRHPHAPQPVPDAVPDAAGQ